MSESLIFIYEPEQTDEVARYVRAHPEAKVVAFDFWAEQCLKEKGIPFESSSVFAFTEEEQDALFTQAQMIAREWYRIPEMSFFQHKGVRIAEALEANFDNYLQYVLYRAHFIEEAVRAHPGLTNVVVPYSRNKRMASGIILAFQLNSLVAIANSFSKRYGFTVTTLGEPTDPRVVLKHDRQPLHHRFILAAVNLLATLQPRRGRKIYASEDWTHIRSFMEKMDDTELVLTDKSELRKMSWRSLIRLRARFLRPSDVAPRGAHALAKEKMGSFRKSWKSTRSAVEKLPYMQVNGHSLWPIVEKAFDFMVQAYPERVIVDIEGITRILRRESIDTVLLRASVSAQYHFFATARIAHSLGIPSVEIQHASALFEPDSVRSRLESSYLATYGTLTKDKYIQNHAYAPERLREIGSPRFDQYLRTPPLSSQERAMALRKLGLDPSSPVMLIAVPAVTSTLCLSPMHISSYELADFILTLHRLHLAVPGVQFLLKFRRRACGERERAYLSDIFPDGGIAITDADLFSMLLLCDFASSGNSTALQEIMIAQRPLILFPWKRSDTYNIDIYGQAGTILFSDQELTGEVRRLISDPAYKEALLRTQRDFLDRNFIFDGKASERTSAFLHESLSPLP